MKTIITTLIITIALSLSAQAGGVNPYSDDTYTTEGGPYSR